MDLYDAMRTTPAVREFTEDPLPDETLHRILEHARFAPSGGNRQGTHGSGPHGAGNQRPGRSNACHPKGSDKEVHRPTLAGAGGLLLRWAELR